MTRRLLIAVLATTLAAPLAAAPAPLPVPPEARSFAVGTIRIAALHDADFAAPNDATTFGVDEGPAAVARVLAAAGAPTDTITLSVSVLLVQVPGHVVLIDTGLGFKANGQLIASLAAAHVAPKQVTDILITHSHGDHIGGLVAADGTLAFPAAKIRMAAAEWAFLQATPAAAKLVAVVAPQVVPFAPGAIVVPGITAVTVAGHTPGHTAYEIVSGRARLLDIGDSAHSSIVSLAKPDWSMAFDSDKAVGRASRRALLTRLSASHERIFSPHFPFPGVGTVAAKGDGFIWVPEGSVYLAK